MPGGNKNIRHDWLSSMVQFKAKEILNKYAII